jgi:DNA-binding GntR family transcriptional regulator
VLECEAVRRACGRINRDELESLARDLARLMENGGRSRAKFVQRAREVDSRLHDLVAASCGNAFLAHELSRLKTLFRAFRDMAWIYEESRSDYRRLEGEAREHLAIVEALLTGNSKAAALAMSQHIKSGIKYWSRALPAALNGNGHAERPSAGRKRPSGKSHGKSNGSSVSLPKHGNS